MTSSLPPIQQEAESIYNRILQAAIKRLKEQQTEK